jgi:rubrerythrin
MTMALPKTKKEIVTAIQQLERHLAIEAALEALGLEQWWRNSYICTECDTMWEDDWSSQCDDRCPNCDTSMSPYASIEINGKGGEPLP